MISNSELGSISEIVMGQSPKIDDVNEIGNGFPLLNGPTEFSYKSPIPVQFTTNGKKFSQPDDILFCVRGSTTGRMNYADQIYAIGRGLAAIRGKNGYPTPYIRVIIEQNLSRLLSAATGSTFPNVGKDLLNSFSVEVSDVETARKISDFIVSIDNKISLNRQINQTLEAMAQALFKSWFVDFEPVKAKLSALAVGGSANDANLAAMSAISGKTTEQLLTLKTSNPDQYQQLYTTADLFPSEMVDSELGEIPKGWSIGVFKDVCQKVESGGTPSRSVDEYWNGDIKWLASGEVRDVIVLDTKEKITHEGLSNSSAKLWPPYSTVVAMYGATAGQVCLIANEMTSNQACCALIPNPEYKSFIFFAARNSIQSLADRASGSAQQNLNKGLVENHPLLIPSDAVALSYEKSVSVLLDAWIRNIEENSRLDALRDFMLPKLLSGELLNG